MGGGPKGFQSQDQDLPIERSGHKALELPLGVKPRSFVVQDFLSLANQFLWIRKMVPLER